MRKITHPIKQRQSMQMPFLDQQFLTIASPLGSDEVIILEGNAKLDVFLVAEDLFVA